MQHWDCNINFHLTEKVPLIFHNLRGYNSHLIFSELDKFDVKISVIPNGLEILMFIDSMRFINSSLDKLNKTCQMKILNT